MELDDKRVDVFGLLLGQAMDPEVVQDEVRGEVATGRPLRSCGRHGPGRLRGEAAPRAWASKIFPTPTGPTKKKFSCSLEELERKRPGVERPGGYAERLPGGTGSGSAYRAAVPRGCTEPKRAVTPNARKGTGWATSDSRIART